MLALALVPVKNAYNGVDLWCEEHGYTSSGQGSPIRLCVVVARTELANEPETTPRRRSTDWYLPDSEDATHG